MILRKKNYKKLKKNKLYCPVSEQTAIQEICLDSIAGGLDPHTGSLLRIL